MYIRQFLIHSAFIFIPCMIRIASMRSAMVGAPLPLIRSTLSGTSFHHFQLTNDECRRSRRRQLWYMYLTKLDLPTTTQMKAVVDLIALFLVELFDHSMSVGQVLKYAYIPLRLKNIDSDLADA